ncbi:hypothetical protein M0811_06395 [Anaeramoeba ignava]|uniref:TLDc domain-containing protein n=1 Tax=Anaeramoeba ignava TaxID=1746090 RepID=A0A9Q0LPJ5_ANAIG|nr:hypothetical protein M0811_06395 [Anaeramoeba ignava]
MKKKLFHSFFSLFDKDSISKQDFVKLKKFDPSLPNSFFINIQNKVIQHNQKENQQMKIEIDKKDKEIDKKWKKKVEDQRKEIEKMKPVFNEYEEEYRKKWLNIFSDSEIIKNIEYVKKLKEWINDDEFFSKMKLGYSAKRDGFDSQNWHKAVDDKGKTLVIIKTKDNFIFGGFTQVGFMTGDSRYIPDPNAFIFSLRNSTNKRKSKKFTIKQDEEQNAIYYRLDRGSCFGNDDIDLNSNLKSGYSDFGVSYNLPNGIKYGTKRAKSYLAGSYDEWVVKELETYFI